MVVREATVEDAAAIAALLDQLGYPSAPEQVAARLRRLAHSAADALWVAEDEGLVVGLAGIHVSTSLEHDAAVAKLSELVVDERRRRAGIGAALVEAAEREARRRGCGILFLTTAERRAEAHAFYRRLGFEETGRRFAKELR
jgi:N-acetylglutamate synthase-like GNAT family acetyltransferase